MRLARIVTPTVVALVAACGGKPAAAPPTDPASNIDVKTISGTVKNADTPRPTCPVIPHFDAVLTVTRLSGKLTYRWERSTGKFGDVKEITIPAAAATGSADVPVESFEWLQTERGVQLAPTAKLHVLTPIDRMSMPVDLSAKCF
jgi:hypothetical protein